eukprot:43165-Rhodomonas_salina.3
MASQLRIHVLTLIWAAGFAAAVHGRKPSQCIVQLCHCVLRCHVAGVRPERSTRNAPRRAERGDAVMTSNVR